MSDAHGPIGERFSKTYTMGLPNRIDRIAYRRLYVEPPWGTTHHSFLSVLVLMLPVSWRWLNRWFATDFGYFWIPCGRCGRDFGGHESGRIIWEQEPHAEGGGSDQGVSWGWRARSGQSLCRYCSHEIQQMIGVGTRAWEMRGRQHHAAARRYLRAMVAACIWFAGVLALNAAGLLGTNGTWVSAIPAALVLIAATLAVHSLARRDMCELRATESEVGP